MSCRHASNVVVVVTTVLVTGSASVAEGFNVPGDVDQLKARDIETMLANEARRRSAGARATENPRAGGPCLFDDVDDDGMADDWELSHDLNPADPDDAWLDPDGDEVVNLFEFQLLADPFNASSPPVVTVARSGGTYSDVAEAIDNAEFGSVIRVAGGVYDVNYITFAEKAVMIQGGWSDDFSRRDLRAHPTTFDGRMQGEVLYFAFSSGNPVVVLDGIRLVRGSGSFGALNLLAFGTASLQSSLLGCVITDSESGFPFNSVLEMHNWESSRSDRTIANTIIACNASSGIYSQVTEQGCAHWRILHTTITANWNGGGDNGFGIDAFTLDAAELTAHLYNGIVRGNAKDQFDVDIHRNISFDVDHADIGSVRTSGGASFTEGEGVVDVDPAFVDPGDCDFHLQSTSPVRDLGIAIGIPTTDHEGDARISGGAPDLGADEFQACPADLDDSGFVDCGDILAILAAWGNAGGPEDLDESGIVDFGDILVVLTAWGPCE